MIPSGRAARRASASGSTRWARAGCCVRRMRLGGRAAWGVPAWQALGSHAWRPARLQPAPASVLSLPAQPAPLPSCLTRAPPKCHPHPQQEIAELTVQKERLQWGADALEKKRGALLAQIAGLKEVGGWQRKQGRQSGELGSPSKERLCRGVVSMPLRPAASGLQAGRSGRPGGSCAFLAAAALCRRVPQWTGSWPACRNGWTRWRQR